MQTNKIKYISYLFIIVALMAIDQYSKYLIVSIFKLNDSVNIIDDFFRITYVQNFGAGFSIMQNETIFFYIITPICLVLFVYLLLKTKKDDYISKVSLLLIIGGTLGNFLDRIFRVYVVDFLDFTIFGWNFPIFNIADSFLTIGVILYIIAILKEEKHAKARTVSE